jgi:trk system potassium uptake protein TrkA
MYVIIVGGGKVGSYLGEDLIRRGHEVTLIEKDRSRCERMTERTGAVAVWGDGCNPTIMEEAGVSRADVVIADTGHDEDNLTICQVAKEMFGVKRTIARANNPKNEETLLRLGVDSIINSTELVAHLIEAELSTSDMVPLIELRRAAEELVKVTLLENAPAAGKSVMDLGMPPDCLLVTVIRDEKVVIPRGTTVLQPGDSILAITSRESLPAFSRLFSP